MPGTPQKTSCTDPWSSRLLAGALGFAFLVCALRFSYVRRVWLEGWPTFADADCFTRMFRVRRLLEDGALIQARHPWENAPDGIVPHTTALLDWIIALIALPLQLLTPEALDWAGWITPPLLAGAGGGLLFVLAARLDLSWVRWPVLLAYALYPLLVWGNAVGRPDHQALLVPLLACLTAAECLRLQENRFHLATGLGWGMALWISLYEPLFLLLACLAGHALAARLCPRTERLAWRPWTAGAAGLFLLTWLLEGARGLQPPLPSTPEMRNWLAMIGELKPAPAAYFALLGLALPIALALRVRARSRPSARELLLLPAVIMVLVMGTLQQRWLYFLPLPLCLLLLPALAGLRSRGLRLGLAVLHLAPMTAWLAWETSQLRPPHALADIQRMASQIKGEGAILAPWWESPALLYYSGNPIVASSSHQSLTGITDSARFFTTSDFTEADEILLRRNVRWVAVEDPVRSFTNARQILKGMDADLTIEQHEVHRIVCLRLWDFKSVPTRYRLVYASPGWKLYRYDPE